MTENQPLAITLRPRRFEDVVGQDHAVRYLSQLIVLGRFCRNILLHGSVGSGKTTLARLYAKGLNCEASRKAGGSPCGHCDPCERFEASLKLGHAERSEFYELDAPSLVGDGQLEAALPRADKPLRHGERRIIFIDEAHALASNRKAFLLLLKRLEEADKHTSYVFATTELDQIPPAVRSRLALLQIHPLPIHLATSFLAQIARENGIAVEPKALTLLAGIGEGQPRDLLQRLEQVATFGEVTVERVRWVFGIDYTDALVQYFQALAVGDYKDQNERFEAWHADIEAKAELIQLFLLSIYYRDILQIDCVFSAPVASIGEPERRDILARFRTRLADDADLAAAWGRMIEFWTSSGMQRTKTALMLHVSQFHRLVNELAVLDDAAPRSAYATPTLPERQKASAKRRGPHNTVRLTPGAKASSDHFDGALVRTLINLASHAVQAYGLRFNARITVWHDAFDGMAGKSITSKFNQGLGWKIGDSGDHKLRRIAIQENGSRGPCTRVIAQVPDDMIAETKTWIAKWLADKRRPGAIEEIIDPGRDRRYKNHKRNVLWLCGGLDPALQGFDQSNGSWRELAACLGIPESDRRTTGAINNMKSFTRSQALYEETLEGLTDAVNPMPFLSAFDDGRWDLVAGPWELAEYEDRKALADERAKTIQQIEGLYPDRRDGLTDAAREVELAELRKSWSSDPRERPRTWETWWSTHTP